MPNLTSTVYTKFLTGSGYTELIPTINNDSQYNIVATGFINLTMPLIRYMTNDICTQIGNGNVQIIGRWNMKDFLIGYNGENIFHSAFNFHSDVFNNVQNYQFIQKKKGIVELRLVVNAVFNDGDLNNIRRELKQKIGETIDFNIVLGDLLLSERGKFNRFVVQITN